MVNSKFALKIHRPSFFMFIIFFWYTTELLFTMRIDSILGVPKETLNALQSYIVLGLLLIKIMFFQHIEKRGWVRVFLCGTVVVIATICSGFNNMLLSLTIFVIAAKDEKLDDIIRMIYRISLVMIPIIILLSLAGIVENYITYRGTIIRYALGFNHANTLGRRLYVLVACRIYLRFYILKWKDYLLMGAAAVFCYIVPNSMTATVSILLLFLLTLAYKIAQKVNKAQAFLFVLILLAVICNIMTIVLGSIDLSKYPILELLDTSIHGRFSTGYDALQTYGVNLFGHEVHVYAVESKLGIVFSKSVYFLDNSYYNILYRYGIIVYIGFSFFFLYNMVLQRQKGNAILVIFLFMIALYGITETELYNLSNNIFLLSLTDVMYISQFHHMHDVRIRLKSRDRTKDLSYL